MNSKERVMAAVSGGAPDRLTVFCGRIDDADYWLSGFGVGSDEELRRLWGLDLRKTSYANVFRTEPGRTIWGCEDNWDAGYSSTKYYPLAGAETVKDIEGHPWPDLGKVDFGEVGRQLAMIDDDKAKIVSISFQTAVFCTLCDLFGMDGAMMNMHLEPKLIEACVERIEGFLLAVTKRILDENAEGFDFFWWGDDFSTQRGMMISPEMWRKYCKPTYLKVFELIKSYGVRVWFHSCGSFAPVIGELVDGGMDVWETVQAHLDGNDPAHLKQEYGERLTFFGAINCQRTLPFGTPEDVRKEVRERFRVLGRGGGYIVGPDHSLQKNIPIANVEALYDEARKCIYG
ncbi:MAG: hypothetical protein FWG03_00065 [Clostridiales bacterium]|nr:hypothetical protein [Clostridiales bacterium]